MDKFAQKRDWKDWLTEKVNIPSAYVERFFKPELERIMNDLRKSDDNIRTILTGQKIGKADVEFTAGRSVKDLLKGARQNFNRRAYLAGVADLGEFHRRLFQATQYIKTLDLSINKIHHKFLFEGLDDKQKENIQGLKEYMSTASNEQFEEYFIKEAGLADFFYNLHGKGRDRAVWEKKYPHVVKDLRDGGDRLINAAESALANILSYLKDMSNARAVRKVDDYMAAAKKVEKEYAKFDGGAKGFRAYYANIVSPYLKAQEEIEKDEATQTKPVGAAPPVAGPGGGPAMPTVPDLNLPGSPAPQATPPVGGPPGASPPFAPPGTTDEPAPDTERNPDNIPIPLTQPKVRVAPQEEPRVRIAPAHKSFYESLQSLSKEDPIILSKYISKYAASIQHSDPATAIELFGIARKIKE